MKKNIAVMLSIITIGMCGWLILNRLNMLDIPSNKNDTYASLEKQKIDKKTDIDACEKSILKSEIDFTRKNKKQLSSIVFQTQIIALVIMIIQLIMLILIFRMPKKVKTLGNTF